MTHTETEESKASKRFWARFFPERQIYLRSKGAVHCVAFSSHRQALAAALSLIVFSWVVYVSADFVFRLTGPDSVPADVLRENRTYHKALRQARAKEASALSLLEEKSIAFERVTSEFEQRHQVLQFLLEGVRNHKKAAIFLNEKGRESVLMQATIDEASPRHNRVAVPSSQAFPDTDNARNRADQIDQAQLQFLDIVEQTLVTRGEYWLSLLKMTGIEIQRLIAPPNTGGPSFDLPLPKNMRADDPFYIRARQVAARLETVRLFEALAEVLPWGNPVGAPSRRTSPFGQRLDPFTGQAAWHSGLDMAAYAGAPIIAPAPGRIVYVGWKSGYGNIVEIEHGFGFRSRYGHLHSFTVKSGESVQTGQQIGIMGTSGRSTGVHLHYEIHFKGKIYDPARFLEAGNYVRRG